MPTIPATLQQNLPQIARIARQEKIRLLLLFGSAARGQMHQGSDLDIGVLFGRPTGWRDVDSLERALMAALGTGQVHLTVLDGALPAFTWEISQDAVVLHEGSPGEYARFLVRAAKQYADTARLRRYQEEFLQEKLRRLQQPQKSVEGRPKA